MKEGGKSEISSKHTVASGEQGMKPTFLLAPGGPVGVPASTPSALYIPVLTLFME